MTSPAKERRKCRLKRRFPTREAAQAKGDFWQQTPYRCPWCKHWHLTSNT